MVKSIIITTTTRANKRIFQWMTISLIVVIGGCQEYKGKGLKKSIKTSDQVLIDSTRNNSSGVGACSICPNLAKLSIYENIDSLKYTINGFCINCKDVFYNDKRDFYNKNSLSYLQKTNSDYSFVSCFDSSSKNELFSKALLTYHIAFVVKSSHCIVNEADTNIRYLPIFIKEIHFSSDSIAKAIVTFYNAKKIHELFSKPGPVYGLYGPSLTQSNIKLINHKNIVFFIYSGCISEEDKVYSEFKKLVQNLH